MQAETRCDGFRSGLRRLDRADRRLVALCVGLAGPAAPALLDLVSPRIGGGEGPTSQPAQDGAVSLSEQARRALALGREDRARWMARELCLPALPVAGARLRSALAGERPLHAARVLRFLPVPAAPFDAAANAHPALLGHARRRAARILEG